MDGIVLRDNLRDSLQKNAPKDKTDINELVNDAVARYVRELQHAKIDLELTAYKSMHDELKRTHFGRWIAIHDQQIVDCDDEIANLHQRIRERYGPTAVLMTQVREQPVQEIRMRPPRIDREMA